MLAFIVSAALASPTLIIDTEWRGMALADHLSHGPGVGLSVGVLSDHLRLGISGFARPGPINGATFTLTPEEPYKGQEQVQLRSDGGLMGPTLSVGLPVGARFRADMTAMVGYGGFGFYLTGEDRVTPDGRLPSAWEDQLMDGHDSSLGLGLDVGPRFTWRATEYLQPYVAARYTQMLGYDAAMRDRYAGVSMAIGLSTGRL